MKLESRIPAWGPAPASMAAYSGHLGRFPAKPEGEKGPERHIVSSRTGQIGQIKRSFAEMTGHSDNPAGVARLQNRGGSLTHETKWRCYKDRHPKSNPRADAVAIAAFAPAMPDTVRKGPKARRAAW